MAVKMLTLVANRYSKHRRRSNALVQTAVADTYQRLSTQDSQCRRSRGKRGRKEEPGAGRGTRGGNMRAVLVFDNVNDLVFRRWEPAFLARLARLAFPAFPEKKDSDEVQNDAYMVSQLLSPLVTSQRVMSAQFGNTYSSMQCKDGTNLAFDEWLDHILMIISEDDVDDIQRELQDLKTLIQHICGQNFNLLHSPLYQDWLSELLDSRTKGDNVPGAGGMIGESGATSAALNALKLAANKIKPAHQHFHLLLYVGDKLLALYSSRGCEDLTPADLILLSVQCVAAQEYWSRLVEKAHEADVDDLTSEDESEFIRTSRVPWLSEENSAIVNMCAGSQGAPCAPHSMHLAQVAPRITLAVLVDVELRDIGIATNTASQVLSNLRRLLLQRNLEAIPAVVDALENAVKKTTDALRRNKANTNLCTRLASRMLELKKSCTTTTPLTPETTAAAMHTALDSIIERLRPDIPQLNMCEPLEEIQEKLTPYVDFLRVKAMRYFSLGSYVEEFPGLVHFILVDRTAGRFMAPDIADCADMVSREKVSAMLSRGMRFVREGYSAATWRTGALHACLVLWWEARGVPVSPRSLHPATVRALPVPGDIQSAFYKQLTELCFPTDAANVSCKELLCIHLGLLPATTAVQQARRLAHTIHDVAYDARPNPADLL